MITFVTLFLGLVHGVHSVDLKVNHRATSVEVRLDDRTVGTLTGPPWRLPVDFGLPPEPHELVATAYDATRKEIGRVIQKINVPRAIAEATLALRPGSGGHGRAARLTWQSAIGPQPVRTVVSFDARPLPAPDPSRIPLPDFVPEQVHFMRAELEFPGNVTAAAEITFGGHFRDETEAQLTAVAVLPAGKLPPAGEMKGWFTANGRPLNVAAVEEGPGEIVIVLDQAARGTFNAIAAEVDRRRVDVGLEFRGGLRNSTYNPVRTAGAFGRNRRARFVWPATEMREVSGVRYEVFPRSVDVDDSDGGLLWAVTRSIAPAVSERPRLADAAATAGLSAASRNRARAVLVILGGSLDGSDLTPAAAASYLASLGVPLFVWRVAQAPGFETEAWKGAVESSEVTDAASFEKAADRLTKHVARQRIVWVEGAHLPQAIALAPTASSKLALAAPPVRPPCRPTDGPAEAAIPAGSRLRANPDPASLALATIDADLTLPVLSWCGAWAEVRWTQFRGWVRLGDTSSP